MSVKLPFISVLIVLAVFLFLRFFRIEDSLLFFADMGRDFMVMHRWIETGKPPLLGPQNSALPFNQSPVYFYFLFIFYYLTGFSLYSTVIAAAVFHIGVFLLGCLLLKNELKLFYSWIVVWLLFAFSPQLIIQHRYIWNPSFVAAFLALAFFAMLLLQKKITHMRILTFSIALGSAMAFSYSAVPTVLIFLGSLFLIFSWKTAIKLLASVIISTIILHAPLILFEIRHDFTLTNLLINYEKLEQISAPPLQKFWSILDLSVTLPSYKLLLLVITAATAAYLYAQRKIISAEHYSPLLVAFIMLLTNIFLLVVIPISVQPHYIFGVLSLFIITIAFLGNKTRLVIVLLILCFWADPQRINSYFQKAWRTIAETQECAVKVCQEVNAPVFVSMQSTLHPYHSGPEFRYLFDKNGCEVVDIELNAASNEFKNMLVVSEIVPYKHGETTYDELTLFGASQEAKVIECSEDLKVHLLTRN